MVNLMNINNIINLLKKNVIILLFFFIIFFYYFYNAYSEIVGNHPKFKISSSWASNYSSSFEDLNLIATSMSVNYKNYITNMNNIVVNYDEDNLSFGNIDKINSLDLNNDFINSEILKMLFNNNSNEGLVDMHNFQDYKSFNIFSNENIEFFYHQQLLRNISSINNLTLIPEILNEKMVASDKPFNVEINISSSVNDDYDIHLKKIDDVMNKSNIEFKSKKLDSVMIFINWLSNEIENTIRIIKNTHNLNQEAIEKLENIKTFALENLYSQRNKVSLIFSNEDFKLFVKSKESIIKLNNQINQKIYLNLFGYLFVYFFIISLFIFCREIISEYYKQ